jgi:hypothetical protein
MPKYMADKTAKIYACINDTNISSKMINTEKMMEIIEVPAPATTPYMADIKNIRPTNTAVTICPESMLANKRIISIIGLISVLDSSINCMSGKTGLFMYHGPSGLKMFFQ